MSDKKTCDTCDEGPMREVAARDALRCKAGIEVNWPAAHHGSVFSCSLFSSLPPPSAFRCPLPAGVRCEYRAASSAVVNSAEAALVGAKAEADRARGQVADLQRLAAGVRAARVLAEAECEGIREELKEVATGLRAQLATTDAYAATVAKAHAVEQDLAIRWRREAKSLRLLLSDALGALEDDETIMLGRPSLDEVTPDGEIHPSIVSRIRTALAKSRPLESLRLLLEQSGLALEGIEAHILGRESVETNMLIGAIPPGIVRRIRTVLSEPRGAE